eukprot:TRINITY_DN18802_c0_g1_i1.p1 TRINITY_DN18802_c0_g1~~TRINITY_DN18802_c0_g1_i1.p1  ORF type:complete len:1489 (+),score=178.62 TRINITY_DN18802_c0_g1_i1:99-4565(+)
MSRQHLWRRRFVHATREDAVHSGRAFRHGLLFVLLAGQTVRLVDAGSTADFAPFKIGVSLSLTGKGSSYDCFWCHDAYKALIYLLETVNAQYYSTMNGDGVLMLTIDIKDDKHDLSACLEHYTTWAKTKKPRSDTLPDVDAFLGPAYFAWSPKVVTALSGFRQPIIMWSFDNSMYQTVPSLLGEKRGPFYPCETDADCTRPHSCSSSGLCYMRSSVRNVLQTLLDVPHWNSSWRGIFDVNVPMDQWGYDSLNKVLNASLKYEPGKKPRRFVFMWIDGLPDSSDNKRRCLDYMNYVFSQADDAWGVAMPSSTLVGPGEWSRTLKIIKTSDIDVLYFCGASVVLRTLTHYLQQEAVIVPYLLTDRPIDTVSVESNYVVTPYPGDPDLFGSCDLLGTKERFAAGFAHHSGVNVSWASLQIVGAVSALVIAAKEFPKESVACSSSDLVYMAYCNVSNRSHAPMSEWIKQYLYGSEVKTCWGALSFAQDGSQKGLRASSQQVLPLLPATTRLSTLTQLTKVVSEEAYDNCFGTLRSAHVCRQLVDTKFQESQSWLEKRLEVYPCAHGCFDTNLQCSACPAGRSRDENQLACLDCPRGKFQDLPGQASCRVCAEGADCSGRVREVSLPGYFRIQTGQDSTANQSSKDMNASYGVMNTSLEHWDMLDNWFQCIGESERTEKVAYNFQCKPGYLCTGDNDNLGDRGCIGANAGVMCGNCRPGYSRFGLLEQRECTRCNVPEAIITATLVTGVIFLLVVLFGREALRSARSPGRCVCSVFRIYLHFVHLLGGAIIVTQLQSAPSLTVINLICNLLIRPIDLFKADCLTANGTSATSMTTTAVLYGNFVEFGLVVLVIYQVVLYNVVVFVRLFKWVQHVMQDCTRWCRKSKKHKKKKDVPSRASTPTADEVLAEKVGVEQDVDIIDVARSAMHVANYTEQVVNDHISTTVEGLKTLSQLPQELRQSGYQKKEKVEEDDFDINYGSGRRFSKLSERNYLVGKLLDLIRKIIVWVMFAQAITACSLTLQRSCVVFTAVDTTSQAADATVRQYRLLSNYDVLCDSPEYLDYTVGVWTYLVYLCGVPLMLLAFLVFIGPTIWDRNVRRACAALFDGYKPEYYWWEACTWFRTSAVFACMEVNSSSTFGREAALLGVLMVFICLQVLVNPYDQRNYNFLNRFELCMLLSVTFLVLTAVLQGLQFKFADVFLVLANCIIFGVFTYGALAIVQSTVSLRIQILIEHGCYVNPAAYAMHQLIRLTMGINQIYCIAREDYEGRIINVARLYEYERRFLVKGITDTVGACIDVGKTFHLALVETSIEEGLQRALNARSEKVRQVYYAAGTKPQRVTPLSVGMYVAMRPLDIPPRPSDIPHHPLRLRHLPKTLRRFCLTVIRGDSWAEACNATMAVPEKLSTSPEDTLRQEEADANRSLAGGLVVDKAPAGDAVTVEELCTALESVNVDILERHPRLHIQVSRRRKHVDDHSDGYRPKELSTHPPPFPV